MCCGRSGAGVESRSSGTEANAVLQETSVERDKVILDAGDIIAVTPTIDQQKTMAHA